MSTTEQRLEVLKAEEAKVEIKVARSAHSVDLMEIDVLTASVYPEEKLLAVSMRDSGGQDLISLFPISNPECRKFTLCWHFEEDERGCFKPLYITEDE